MKPNHRWWWVPIDRGWHLHYSDGDLPFDESSLVAHLQPRPHYCDRGRWIAQQLAFDVDRGDGFPRYYMDLHRAKEELQEWCAWRLTCLETREQCPQCDSTEAITCAIVEQRFKVTLRPEGPTHEVSTPAPQFHCGKCGLEWTGYDAEVRRTLRQEALLKEQDGQP